VTPKGTSDVDLPPSDRTALQIVQGYLAVKTANKHAEPA
jgi:hypothetical protein